MDAYVQVALIEKSKRVFAADAGAFLSFPLLSPLTFKPQELASLSTPATAADYTAAANFARIVNFLPRDMVASVGSESYLWDVYADVLARADVADGNTAHAGQGNVGSSILYAPDGSGTESDVYRAYRQYRDAYIVAQEDYGEQKLTATLSEDPAVQKNWTDVLEPVLRAVMTKAADDWQTLGHRAQVEAALQAERDAALNDPHARWQEWVNGFNPDIDLLSDTGGARYAPTGLSPKDFTSDTAWLHFNLSAAEMASLVREAPDALKVVLDDDGGSAIDHVSFDYRSVALVRPWFRSNVLTSRIWRSTDPQLMLSDGADPPAGACPGYVSAVVFVRNVQVNMRASSSSSPGPVQSDLRFTIAANRLTQRDLTAALVRTRPAATAAVPATAQVAAFKRLDNQSLTLLRPAQAQPAVALRAAPMALRVAPAAMMRDTSIESGPPIRTIPTRVPPRTIPQPPQGPPTPSPAPAPPAQSDDIAILAFICKRLPKTPDPTPDLVWT